MEISGNIVDIKKKSIYPGRVIFKNKIIEKIIPLHKAPGKYIMPGFIDAHVHIESSMLLPVEFARLAARHGTVGIVADPHEIANVMGVRGIRYMVKNSKIAPIKIKFGIPSCVPATEYETSGAVIGANEIERFFKEDKQYHLAEVMNFPGVIHKSKEVMEKIEVAKKYGRIIDGHAPGLSGEDLKKYVKAGIYTDHECTTLKEAEEKISLGMHILIREGSAAKNYEALAPLIVKYPDRVMFCTDDCHPDDLVKGHIRNMVLRSIKKGYNLWKVLQTASENAIKYYKLKVGLLQVGDPADFIVCDNFKEMNIRAVYVNGEEIFDGRNVRQIKNEEETINRFECESVRKNDIVINYIKGKKIRVIGAKDGSLLTEHMVMEPKVEDGKVVCDTAQDILKIVVVNRYQLNKQVVGMIHGFGMKTGALASSIAHDSHNLIAVGTDDEEIVNALNTVIREKGGIAVVNKGITEVLPLPVGGLMSTEDGLLVAEKYKMLNKRANETGTSLRTPFMTLSFMALLVVPDLKISDKGLFDVRKFGFTELFV